MDIRRTAKETDPNAFQIVCDAREIPGDGFGSNSEHSLLQAGCCSVIISCENFSQE